MCVLRCCFPSLASSSPFPQLYRHNRYRNIVCIEAAQEVFIKIKNIYVHMYTQTQRNLSAFLQNICSIIYSRKHTYRLIYNFVIFLKLLYFNLKNNGLNFNQSCQSFKCAVNKALKYNGLNLPVISIIVRILVF